MGQDVVLSCRLSPQRDARSLDVRWIRDHISETVHHYRNGEDLYGEQMEAYAGRTELVRDGLSAGSLDLRITGLRPSDDGQYVCTVEDADTYDEAIVELEVSGADPHLSLGGYEAGGVRVLCRSAGWYPLPQLLWRDARGQHLPSVSQTHSQDQEGLFEIEGTVIVTGSVEGPLSCVVRNSRIQQERESSLHIAAPFFINAQPLIVVLALVLVLLAVSIGLGVYLFRKQAAQSRELGESLQSLPTAPGKVVSLREGLGWVGSGGLCAGGSGVLEEQLEPGAAEIEQKDARLDEQAAELAWRKFLLPHNTVKVTLDPDTAHPMLVLSQDNSSVRYKCELQQVPDTPERFYVRWCVLGREEFREGRHCWLVEVEGEQLKYSGWAVGVARASVERKKWINMSPEEGIWAVQYNEGQLKSLTSPPTPLSLSSVPTRIWVCLDCTQGQVSFINADNGVEIFTFTAVSFNGESIRPWFWIRTQGIQLCLRDSTLWAQDVVLPCHLSPQRDARTLEVRWIRDNISETVHHYRNGEDLKKMQDWRNWLPNWRNKLQSWRKKLKSWRNKLQSWHGEGVCCLRTEVTLDPCTAHPQLVLSQDNSSVRWEDISAQVPDTPGRFDESLFVLGREEFREGRHCWLVEVEGESLKYSWWAVGVARASLERKGKINMSPTAGIWAVEYYYEHFQSVTSPPTDLPLSPVPTRIWVCLDCTQGQVSFINADNGVEIFTFTAASFNGESIRPWFMMRKRGVQLCLRDSTLNPSFTGHARGLLTSLVTLLLLRLGSAQLTVVGPGHSVTATVGQDVVLSCRLSPQRDARTLEVRWIRHRLSETVHHYRNGEDLYGEQMEAYAGRTELVRDGLSAGSLDLRITGLRPSDDGQYVCTVGDADAYDEAIVELEVSATGTDPHLSLGGYEAGGVRVLCRSAGWYPLPWVWSKGPWLGGQGAWLQRGAGGKAQPPCRCSHPATKLLCSPPLPPPLLFSGTEPRAGSQEVPHLLPRGAAPGPELGKACPGLSSAPDGLAPSVPAVKVTLDPCTAHPQLVLSQDNSSVRCESEGQQVPDRPERFNYWCCVLGREEFREGRHCWLVEVEGERLKKSGWAVGVARTFVERKGKINMSPREGIWALEYYCDNLTSLTSPPTHLPLSPVPTRIWVCLDCTQGKVSFIDADNGVQIFTFTAASFNGESIRPWFWLRTGGIQLCLRDSTPQTLSPALGVSCPSPDTPASPLLGPAGAAQE
ncbi:Butyrophilin subfamily 3 member A3 [Aix galericulata]|nr:Butyrophilin subfamily 3 member A3 [Aix galericulata]